MNIVDYLRCPKHLGASMLQHFGGWIPDRIYLQLLFRLKMDYRLDLKNPRTYCEKQQWLKLYDRRPEYSKMVDKYYVKEYVAGIIGKEHVIPTYGVWDTPDAIEWDRLPDRFVLKTTHGGGGCGVIICQNKACLDKNAVICKLQSAMKYDIYKSLREWPYKRIPHRIIAEQLLEEDAEGGDVPDYKFYCFNGEPKVLLIASNRFTAHNFDYFDMEFKKLPITSSYGGNSEVAFAKPTRFEEMKAIASTLSKGIPHVRVDLYFSCKKVYFGELTFFDSSGFDNLSSESLDREWGDWIHLPDSSR